jgi:hypothetical protein
LGRDIMGVMENSDLLRELRIDRGAVQPTSRRPLWIGLGVIAALAVAGAAWFALSGSSACRCTPPLRNRCRHPVPAPRCSMRQAT